MLSNQWVLISVLLLASFVADSLGSSNEAGNLRALKRSYEDLELYVERKCVGGRLNHADCLKVIQSSLSMVAALHPERGRLAAKTIVHLNKFNKCDKRAVEHLGAMLRGRPGKNYALYGRKDGNSRLATIIEVTFIRARQKCLGFIENLFQDIEEKIRQNTRDNLLTREAVERANELDSVVVEVSSASQPDSAKRLMEMQRSELFQFYFDYLTKNLKEPCKNYALNLAPVISLGESIFKGPLSKFQPFETSKSRFDLCQQVVKDFEFLERLKTKAVAVVLKKRASL